MKTQKELESLNITQPVYKLTYEDGYRMALKDILKLIDEFDLVDYDEGGVWSFVAELKKRITGEKCNSSTNCELLKGIRTERARIINLIKKKFVHNIQFAENLIEDINRTMDNLPKEVVDGLSNAMDDVKHGRYTVLTSNDRNQNKSAPKNKKGFGRSYGIPMPDTVQDLDALKEDKE